VRDTLAFTMLPEPGTWIPAQDALFVAGSTATGGMGAQEIVPFGDRAAAERFRIAHGGEIFRFGEVPAAFVLGNGDGVAAAPTTAAPAHGVHASH
jgi:copper chaperone NosL